VTAVKTSNLTNNFGFGDDGLDITHCIGASRYMHDVILIIFTVEQGGRGGIEDETE
jgi:hypothetical protein